MEVATLFEAPASAVHEFKGLHTTGLEHIFLFVYSARASSEVCAG